MLKTIQTNFKQLLLFVKHPKDQAQKTSFKNKLRTLAFIFILDLVLTVSVVFLFKITGLTELLQANENAILELMKEIPMGMAMFLLIAFIPFIEELVFRLPLRFSTNFINGFLILASKLFGSNNAQRFKKAFKRFWHQTYGFTFYIITILFALMHASNYQNSMSFIYLWPIIVLPQFLVGLFMGYLRVKFNLWYGFALHFLHNMAFLLPALLMGFTPVEVYNYESENCSIAIQEEFPFKGKQLDFSIEVKHNGIEFNHMSLGHLAVVLLNSGNSITIINGAGIQDQVFSVKYNENFKHRKEEKDTLITHLARHFNFTISYDTLEHASTWLLYAHSDSLLEHNKVQAEVHGKFNVSNQRIFSDAANTSELGRVLGNMLQNDGKIAIKSLGNPRELYKFEINSKDFEEVKSILLEEYGLQLIKCLDYAVEPKLFFEKQ